MRPRVPGLRNTRPFVAGTEPGSLRDFRPLASSLSRELCACLRPLVVRADCPTSELFPSASDMAREDCWEKSGALAMQVSSERATFCRDSKTYTRSPKNELRASRAEILPVFVAAIPHQKAAITNSKRPFEPTLREIIQSSLSGASRLRILLDPSFLRHAGCIVFHQSRTCDGNTEISISGKEVIVRRDFVHHCIVAGRQDVPILTSS